MDKEEKLDAQGLGGLFDRAYDAGTAAANIFETPGGKTYAMVPDGYEAVLLDEFLEKPRALEIALSVRTLDGFNAYVSRHGKEETGAIFADVKGPAIVAVLDYHGANNEPTRRKHRVHYQPVLSEEWKAWSTINGKWMAQGDMIRFIEEHQLDIREPDGATILELVGVLEAKRNVSFKSGVRLDNTTMQLAYVEETTASAGGVGGQIAIPTELVLGIPVFYGATVIERVRAFFRYKINDNKKLELKIDLYRPQQILDNAFGDMIKAVREEVELPLYEAALPS